jgi:hypothetical protein
MSRNKFKFRRQIIAAGGIASTGGIDITAASTFVGAVTFTASPVLSAGISALAAPIIAGTGGYFADKVQSLTDYAALTDTGGSSKAGYQAILGYGITTLTITGTSGTTAGSTANDLVFKLNSPIKAGVQKDIFITGSSASTKVVSIRTATSTHTFFGSTKNSIAFTTTVNDLGVGFNLRLRGLSTTQWAVVGPSKLSTAAAFAGATA